MNDYGQRVATVVDAHAPDRGAVVGVAGHTHEYLDQTWANYRIVNPGSATGVYPASAPTMAIATVDRGDITISRVSE